MSESSLFAFFTLSWSISAGFVPQHLLDATDHWIVPLPEHSRSLRYANAYRLPRPKKAILSRSPLYASLSVWNSLPQKLRSQSLKLSFSISQYI